MQRILKLALLPYLLFALAGCSSLNGDYKSLIGKEIDLGGFPVSENVRFRIVNYISSDSCTPCRLQPAKWEWLISNVLDSISGVEALLIVESDSAKANTSSLPIFYDSEKRFIGQNHLPEDERFHCFLLDSASRVAIIGNPIQNPRIRELYISAICQGLGVDSLPASQDSQQPSDYHDFGCFPFSEAQAAEFLLRNDSGTEFSIDTVFTSCSCTTASADRKTVAPGDAAVISVSFKADEPGPFMREVYVKSGRKTRIFAIRGTAE